MGRRPNKRKFIDTTKMPRVKRKYTRRVQLRRVQSGSISASHPQQSIGLTWADDGTGSFRVWRNDWFNDQFEVMSEAQLNSVKYVCARFSIPLHEKDLVSED